jgi:hypothetical protein
LILRLCSGLLDLAREYLTCETRCMIDQQSFLLILFVFVLSVIIVLCFELRAHLSERRGAGTVEGRMLDTRSPHTPRRTPIALAAIESAFPAFRVSSDSGDIHTGCPVCLDAIMDGEACRALSCHHRFHAECIAKWLSRQRSEFCPMCRRDYSDMLSAQRNRWTIIEERNRRVLKRLIGGSQV